MASASSERRRAQIRAAQPKWGQDYEGVRVHVWGHSRSNAGGVCLRLCRPTTNWSDIFSFYNGGVVPGFLVRLDTRLRLSSGIRNWAVYDGAPLWPHSFDYDDSSDPHVGYSSDSDSEDE